MELPADGCRQRAFFCELLVRSLLGSLCRLPHRGLLMCAARSVGAHEGWLMKGVVCGEGPLRTREAGGGGFRERKWPLVHTGGIMR